MNRALTRKGMTDALPLYIPAVPFALVLGLAIVESGLDPFIGWLSSPLIFGGAAQLTLITLLGDGVAVLAAITAALVVQARHLMYSAALAPLFQNQPRWFRWVGPYVLIDQMFALTILRSKDDPGDFRSYYLGAGATFWTFWMVTTAAGLLLGPVVPEQWNLGLAVPILFVGLIVMGIDRWPKLAAALAAAAVTYLFAGLPNRSGLLVGALAGLVVGVAADRVRR